MIPEGLNLEDLSIDELRELRNKSDIILQEKKQAKEEADLKENAALYKGKWFVKYDKTMNLNAALVEDIHDNPTFYHIKDINYTGRGFINATYTMITMHLEDAGCTVHMFEPKEDEQYLKMEYLQDVKGNINVDELTREVTFADVCEHINAAHENFDYVVRQITQAGNA